MEAQLAIKGTREGLVIQVPEGLGETAVDAILGLIEDKADFFRGARVAVDLQETVLGAAQLGRLRDELAGRDVHLWAVLSQQTTTRTAAADLGLATELKPTRSVSEDDEPFDTEVCGDEAVFVRRTLRSGHSLRHPGHVIVLGDVNPGAEIIAGGSVIVWGRLRGVVHAGATGDEEAMVCALDLAPTQLRIAGRIAVSPERSGPAKPEVAFLREGQLVAERWDGTTRRWGG